MQIQIIAVTLESKPTAKGSYQVADVTYKDIQFNTVKQKKLMSFGAQAPAFEVLKSAQAGETYEVQTNKNDKGYIDFVAASKAGSQQASSSAAPNNAQASPARVGSWETPEERAKKQIYIVRQSSISAAVSALAVGSKAAPAAEAVIEYAKALESYVFSSGESAAPDQEEFDDLPQ